MKSKRIYIYFLKIIEENLITKMKMKQIQIFYIKENIVLIIQLFN